MSALHRIGRRLRALFQGAEIDAELDEEIRQHIELEAADIARRDGVSLDEARRRALVAFGGVTQYREQHRDVRGVRWLEVTMRELRHAARRLWRSPGFTWSAIGVLALGIGATTAVYSAVNAVMRNPTHDDLAIVLFRGFPSLSQADFLAIQEQQRSFAHVGGMRVAEAAFRADGEPEPLQVGRVTSGFLPALDLRPVAGRLIEPADEVVGAEQVVVLSHDVAQRTFGEDVARAVGRVVTVDGFRHTVVGVVEPSREFLAARAEAWTALQQPAPTRRGPFGMLVVGRLARGATFESATADVRAISEQLVATWPQFPAGNARFEAAPVRTAALANPSRMLRIFAAAVALVLLIGVANVASLMLVRSIRRAPELSMRAALGANVGQLVRLFMTESALISVAGAIAGVAVGAVALRALVAFGPPLPGLDAASLDTRAVLFAATIAITAGLFVGMYPVVRLLRAGSIGVASGERAVGGGRGAGRVRNAFVVAQFGLALPLLAVSGLLLVSFGNMQRVDPGFDASNLLSVRVSLPSGQYGEPSLVASYWTRALAEVAALPGVEDVGLASSMPPNDFGSSNDNFNLMDRPAPPGMEEPNSPWPFATAGFFAALGVPVVEGRSFIPSDTGMFEAVLVSRSWAERHYPGESPIGKRMVRGGCVEGCPFPEIVGVVEDVRFSGLTGPGEAMYSPVELTWPGTLFLFVRPHLGRPGRDASGGARNPALRRSTRPDRGHRDDGGTSLRDHRAATPMGDAARLLRERCTGAGGARRVRHALVHGRIAPPRARRAPGPRRSAAHGCTHGGDERAPARARRIGDRSGRRAAIRARADEPAVRSQRPRRAHARAERRRAARGRVRRLLAARASCGRDRSAGGDPARLGVPRSSPSAGRRTAARP